MTIQYVGHHNFLLKSVQKEKLNRWTYLVSRNIQNILTRDGNEFVQLIKKKLLCWYSGDKLFQIIWLCSPWTNISKLCSTHFHPTWVYFQKNKIVHFMQYEILTIEIKTIFIHFLNLLEHGFISTLKQQKQTSLKDCK